MGCTRLFHEQILDIHYALVWTSVALGQYRDTDSECEASPKMVKNGMCTIDGLT